MYPETHVCVPDIILKKLDAVSLTDPGTERAMRAAGGVGCGERGTKLNVISASYSYFSALIGSTRDARCAGMKPAHSATSASATADSASTAGSAPVI
jgi:hypothetical protein